MRLGPGEGVICDSLEPGGLKWKVKRIIGRSRSRAPTWRRWCPISSVSPGLQAEQHRNGGQAVDPKYLDGLQGDDALGNEQEARIFGEHLLDLIIMAIGAKATLQLAERRGVRAMRHAAVLREIERNIGDSRLSAATVAQMLGVTPRYMHFLLEESGRTFSEHVLARQARSAVEALRDEAKSNLKISAIARQAGFTDMSYFNRSFRSHFGDTPSGLRKRPYGASGSIVRHHSRNG